MRAILSFSLIVLLVSACDSPRNHRVEAGDQIDKSLVTMRFAESSLEAQVHWLTGPVGNIESESQLLVILKDQNGNRASLPEGLSLNFYATMPSMGHPMDDAGFFEELEVGIFLNKKIRYNMQGDWRNELWLMDKEFNIKDRVVWEEFF